MPSADTRKAAVAGSFYPNDSGSLRSLVERLLGATTPAALPGSLLRALIVPHAGFRYSGATAAHAYALLRNNPQPWHRVVMLGPAHRTRVRGFALPGVRFFSTPLGKLPIDQELLQTSLAHPLANIDDEAHADEHSLEVQLPFLQTVLADFTVLPVAVGRATPQEVVSLIKPIHALPDTLLIISSDLSHFLDYDQAIARDRATSQSIENLEANLEGQQACGAVALNGLLLFARQAGWLVQTLDLRNSGDAGGERQRVVGYGAYAVYGKAP